MSKRSDWFERMNAQEGVKLGIISSAVFMDYVRYKEFLVNREKGLTDWAAAGVTAESLNVSRRTVERAVIFFED